MHSLSFSLLDTLFLFVVTIWDNMFLTFLDGFVLFLFLFYFIPSLIGVDLLHGMLELFSTEGKANKTLV